jgi:hypothetical protein
LERQTTKKKNTLLQSYREERTKKIVLKLQQIFLSKGKGRFDRYLLKELNKIPYIMYFYVSFLQCFGTGTGSFCPSGIGIRTGMHSGSGSGSVFGFGSNIKME